jgi:hypothetical protein
VTYTGRFAALTWATNAVGLALAILLVSLEWMARANGKTVASNAAAKATR